MESGARRSATCVEKVSIEGPAEGLEPFRRSMEAMRLAVAATPELLETEKPERWSHVRVATKYPSITKRHFAARDVQAECIKLNGALELAPRLGLCRRVVDLVSTGATLRANGLVEVETIAHITSRLAVNRAALKTRSEEINFWIDRFRDALDAG